TSSPRPTGSSTWAPRPGRPAAGWSRWGHRAPSRGPRRVEPVRRSDSWPNPERLDSQVPAEAPVMIPSRYGIALAALAMVFLGSLDSSGAPAESPAGCPNLLLIIADDHAGGTLGIEGDPRRATPNLDALARQGVLFERAYCNSPLCTPSRQSLITGKLPHTVGVTQLATRLSDEVLTMGEWFRDLDYRTAAIGKMHFNGPSTHGFAARLDTFDWREHLRE